MQVLILGGTGAMGVFLVDILAAKGYKIDVTSRKVHKSEDKNIKYLLGNAHELNFIKSILNKNYDAIIDFMVYTEEEFRQRVNYLLKSTKQYIFLSSSRVYANSGIITESSPRLYDISTDEEYLSTDEYALSKARQENILKNFVSSNWTVIRPYITYSDERLQLGVYEKEHWLYRALHGRTIVFPKDIASHVTSLTYGYDVSKVIADLVGKELALGKMIHIVTPQSIYWRDILELYLDVIEQHTNKRPKVHLTNDSNDISTVLNCKYQIKYDRQFDRIFDSELVNIK